MNKDFNQVLNEYLELKQQLIDKFKEIEGFVYEFETPNIGEYWGWYELCEVEFEIYDNLQLVYEDQDKEEEDVLNFSF